VLPSALGLLVFLAGPLIAGLFISFTNWDMLSPPTFVGLSNYLQLFRDPFVWLSLKNTLYYSALTIPGIIVTSLALALAVNRAVFVSKVYRTVFFIPVVSSMVAVALMWKWVYNEQFGLLNWLLSRVGLPELGWLSDPRLSMLSVALVAIWKSMGYYMVLFLAGLQGIPEHLYEAATIDGAGPWRRFWNITLPLLSPTMFFVLIISVIGSFQVFDQVYVMTQGGPGNSTLVFNYYLYQNAFEFFRMGYASALAYVLFALIFVITLLQVKLVSKRVHYD
jgi:multiple sugar transport system permease protein